MSYLLDWSGGESTRLPADRIDKDQCQLAINAIVRDSILHAMDTVSDEGAASEGTLSLAVVSTGGTNPLQLAEANVFGAEYQGWYFWASSTNTGAPKKRQLSSGTVQTLGLPVPPSAPVITTIAGGTVITLAESTQYLYTYYNTLDASESAPSDLSAAVTLANCAASLPAISCSDTQVTHINWYRLSAGAILAVTTVAVNTVSRDALDPTALGAALLSTNYSPPESDLDGIAGPYLGMLFAWKGNKVMWSVPGKPNAWPATYFQTAPHPVKAVVPMGQSGLLVLTDSSTHLLTGSSPTGLVWQDVDLALGCVDGRTARHTPHGVLFVSPLGVTCYAGGMLRHLTRHRLRETFQTSPQATYADEIYRVWLSGVCHLLDCRAWPDLVLTRSTLSATGGVCQFGAYAYFLKDGRIYKVHPEKPTTPVALSYQVTTREFHAKSPGALIHARKVSVRYVGALTVEIWGDGTKRHTETLPTRATLGRATFYAPDGLWCDRIWAVLTGTGELHHFGFIQIDERGEG